MRHHRLGILLLAISGLLATGALSPAHAAPVLTPVARIGDGMDAVGQRLKGMGFEVTTVRYDDPRGMERGLLRSPHLLAWIQSERIKHPLFAKLPGAGPTFLIATSESTRAVYAFQDGKLWGYAAEVKNTSVAPSESPFSASRLEPLRSAVEHYLASCGASKSTGVDGYGNAFAWSGTSCQGGSLRLKYDPDTTQAIQVFQFP